MNSPITITLAEETLHLLPERALYWPRRKTLFVADLHWGKDATFRAAGIALPEGTTSADLTRLSRVVANTGAQRIVVLGDLLHARQGRDKPMFAVIAAWREQQREIEMLLVRGNHDARAGDPPANWQIRTVDAPHFEAPFVLHHFPPEDSVGYALAGHVHPAMMLGGRQRLKLPCFWFGPRVGVLPAFGGFTGSAVIAPAPADRVFVIADDEVVDISRLTSA